MKLTFPENFLFGTSTAAYQIETAFEHDWCGFSSRDGHIFERTTDHEKKYKEDASIIASLAPNYRMSLMWSKLQRAPLAEFNPEAAAECHVFLQDLKDRGVGIMMVLHHFANPQWFSKLGGWEKAENIVLWLDYVCKFVDEFGAYVSIWNTFNEPNLYTSLGWIRGEFPPHKKNIFLAKKVIKNIAAAHQLAYKYIKQKDPLHLVGISHNCTVFAADNIFGWLPAKFLDYWFMEYPPGLFIDTDFFGMSYYARIGHDPFPVTNLLTPEKIKKSGKAHDDMWEYYPQGMKECMLRYWHQYKKPIIITENGICTQDDTKRVRAIYDYIKIMHEVMQEGVDVLGYYHWSAWDNFEWSLGPTYKFGLYECDMETKEKTKKPSADIFSQLAYSRKIDITLA